MIQNIKVVENHYEYKVSKIPFLVYLMKTSSIKEAEHPEIPPDVHVITRFTDIIIGVAPCDTLVGMCISQIARMDNIIVCQEYLRLHCVVILK